MGGIEQRRKRKNNEEKTRNSGKERRREVKTGKKNSNKRMRVFAKRIWNEPG